MAGSESLRVGSFRINKLTNTPSNHQKRRILTKTTKKHLNHHKANCKNLETINNQHQRRTSNGRKVRLIDPFDTSRLCGRLIGQLVSGMSRWPGARQLEGHTMAKKIGIRLETHAYTVYCLLYTVSSYFYLYMYLCTCMFFKLCVSLYKYVACLSIDK